MKQALYLTPHPYETCEECDGFAVHYGTGVFYWVGMDSVVTADPVINNSASPAAFINNKRPDRFSVWGGIFQDAPDSLDRTSILLVPLNPAHLSFIYVAFTTRVTKRLELVFSLFKIKAKLKDVVYSKRPWDIRYLFTNRWDYNCVYEAVFSTDGRS